MSKNLNPRLMQLGYFFVCFAIKFLCFENTIESDQIFVPPTSVAGLLFYFFFHDKLFCCAKAHRNYQKSLLSTSGTGLLFSLSMQILCFGKTLKNDYKFHPRLLELNFFLVSFPVQIFLLWKYN